MKIVSQYNLVLCPITGHFNPTPTEGPDGPYSPVPLWEERFPGQWERYWGSAEGEGPISDMKIISEDLELWLEEERDYIEWLNTKNEEGHCSPLWGGDCLTRENWEMLEDYIPF